MWLRIDSEAGRRLGFEGHVCELQLTTRAFADHAEVRTARARAAGRADFDGGGGAYGG